MRVVAAGGPKLCQLRMQPVWFEVVQAGMPSAGRSCAIEIGRARRIDGDDPVAEIGPADYRPRAAGRRWSDPGYARRG